MLTLHNNVAYGLAYTIRQIARLLRALQVMHMRGVIHDKITTERIMVGEHGMLTLFDFSSCVISNGCAAKDGGN